MKHNLVLVKKEEHTENECPERFCKFLRSIGCDNISIFGYPFFKDIAESYGATKTMRRGNRYYAYFGNMYVRF